MIFSYKAQTFEGDNVSGTIDSDSVASVRNTLLQRKLIVRTIKEVKKSTVINIFAPKVNRREMIFVFKNFSTMIKAGIPIMQSIDIMKDQVKQPTLRKALDKMRLDLNKGLLLSESITETGAFPELVPAIVRIGEEAGTLDKSFLQLSVYYLKQDKTAGKIIGAMIYPSLTILVAMGAVWYLTTSVLPVILKVLPNKDNVWLPTKILLWISDNFSKYGILPVVVFFGLIITGVWLGTTVLKSQKDYMLLKLPLYGGVIKKSKEVQFTTTLAILTEAGVNITDALDILIQVIGNEAFRDNLRAIKGGVIKGETISKNLSPKLFDKLVITIVSIGESTGDMQKPLQDIAEYLDEEVDRTVNNMVNMITPISILFLAGIVGMIVLGVLGPMFSMYGSVQ